MRPAPAVPLEAIRELYTFFGRPHSRLTQRLCAEVHGRHAPFLLEFSLQSAIFLTARALENAMPNEGDARNKPQLGASDSGNAADDAPFSAIEKNLMNIAEELGAWLGTAERKTTDFLSQQNIKDPLVKIRDTAARLLAQLEKGRERSR